jgi:hypothetical protein
MNHDTLNFLQVFRDYNLLIWPLHLVSFVVCFITILMVIIKKTYSSKVVFLMLALQWLWVGIHFQILFFSRIDPLAYFFGIIFIIQGILYVILSFKSSIVFSIKKDPFSLLGLIFFIYAFAGYPLVRYLSGYVYPDMAISCVVPCPLVVFTFGLYMFALPALPRYILIIPAFWSLSAFYAVHHGIYEDIGLIIIGTLSTIIIFIIKQKKNYKKQCVKK